MYMGVCLHNCLCADCVLGPMKTLRGLWIPLALGLQTAASHHEGAED